MLNGKAKLEVMLATPADREHEAKVLAMFDHPAFKYRRPKPTLWGKVKAALCRLEAWYDKPR